MEFVLLAVFALVAAVLLLSLVLNLWDLHWRCDIETEAGQRKLARLGYERLELVRLRLKQGRDASVRFRGVNDSDFTEIPLSFKPTVPGKRAWEAGLPGKKIELFSYGEGQYPPQHLRVVGYVGGMRHLVYRTYFTEERMQKMTALVDEYNSAVHGTAGLA